MSIHKQKIARLTASPASLTFDALKRQAQNGARHIYAIDTDLENELAKHRALVSLLRNVEVVDSNLADAVFAKLAGRPRLYRRLMHMITVFFDWAGADNADDDPLVPVRLRVLAVDVCYAAYGQGEHVHWIGERRDENGWAVFITLARSVPASESVVAALDAVIAAHEQHDFDDGELDVDSPRWNLMQPALSELFRLFIEAGVAY